MFISSYIFSFGFTYLVMFKRLETQIDANEVRYRFFPWSGWHKIPWSEIDEAYIREFALVGEYPQGIGGIRQGPGGWVYSMNGTWGLQLVKKSGARILLGTQRPTELSLFLATCQAATN